MTRHPSLRGYTCVYCGRPAGTKDHVPSKAFSNPVWLVRACAQCNRTLGTFPSAHLTDRAQHLLDYYTTPGRRNVPPAACLTVLRANTSASWDSLRRPSGARRSPVEALLTKTDPLPQAQP